MAAAQLRPPSDVRMSAAKIGMTTSRAIVRAFGSCCCSLTDTAGADTGHRISAALARLVRLRFAVPLADVTRDPVARAVEVCAVGHVAVRAPGAVVAHVARLH